MPANLKSEIPGLCQPMLALHTPSSTRPQSSFAWTPIQMYAANLRCSAFTAQQSAAHPGVLPSVAPHPHAGESLS